MTLRVAHNVLNSIARSVLFIFAQAIKSDCVCVCVCMCVCGGGVVVGANLHGLFVPSDCRDRNHSLWGVSMPCHVLIHDCPRHYVIVISFVLVVWQSSLYTSSFVSLCRMP